MYKRTAAVLMLIVLTLTMVACGQKTPAEPPLEGEITDLAGEFVGKLTSGDYEGAVSFFDPTMKKVFPEKNLSEEWQALLEQVGMFHNEIGKRTETIQGFDVVFVTLQFENALIDIRVVFNSDQRIAGLFFQPAQSQESLYSPPSYANPELFTETEVEIGSGEWVLPGTLTIPVTAGPHTAVVLIHGSGPQDRDETIGPNKPFKDLALGLASQGVAVLRFEKRTKEYQQKLAAVQDTITVKEETIEDALSAVTLLKNNELIDSSKVFVLGHSLGGTLAPRIGKADDDIAGLIIMAGSVRPLEDLILEQVKYLYSLDNSVTPKEEADELKKLEEQIANVKNPKLSAAVPAEKLPFGIPASYWLDLRTYDVLETAGALNVPILILQGERDYQVTMDDFLLWQQNFAGRNNVILKSYPELNHLFMSGEGKSAPEEYNKPGNIAQNVVRDIAEWLKKQ